MGILVNFWLRNLSASSSSRHGSFDCCVELPIFRRRRRRRGKKKKKERETF